MSIPHFTDSVKRKDIWFDDSFDYYNWRSSSLYVINIEGIDCLFYKASFKFASNIPSINVDNIEILRRNFYSIYFFLHYYAHKPCLGRDEVQNIYLIHLIFKKTPKPVTGIMQLIESDDLTNIQLAYLLTYPNEEL